MPAKVERDDAERASEIAAYLVQPAKIALRPAVNEQQGGSPRVAPLSRVELEPAAAEDLVRSSRNRRRHLVRCRIAIHLYLRCAGVLMTGTLRSCDRDDIRACT